jgi:hypothetical protein
VSRKPSKAAEKRRAAAVASKERRKKVLAFGGLGLLAVILFIQGPKLLELFTGPAATVAAPATPGPATSEQPAAPSKELQALRASGVDPFAVRSIADNEPKPGSVPAPAGVSDPFQEISSPQPAAPVATPKPAAAPPAQPLPGTIVVGTPKEPNAVGKRGWIVVIASIPVRSGRLSAERFAKQVRADGLRTIGVLESSRRKPLRAGYFVVYNGPYSTLSAVQRAASHVRAFGYRTAYVREIIRY